MKIRLSDALHARPAHLLVQLAARFSATVELRKGQCRVSAGNILDVLSLGAASGDEIEVAASGDDAERALSALQELIERRFDADLVPETGTAVAAGIGIGRAVVIPAAVAEAHEGTPRSPDEEGARIAFAAAAATREIEDILRVLRPDEARLFAPEAAMVVAMEPRLLDRVARGEPAESAVIAETAAGSTDLFLDVRARLLAHLDAHASRAVASALAAHGEVDIVVVAADLAPSLVALLPKRAAAIVAVDPKTAGFTSHAAILARGRNIPVAFVADHVASQIADGDLVVVDTTESPARVWVSPSPSLVDDARARGQALARAGDTKASVEHLGIVVTANVGSLHDDIPAGAEGVGLVRTELLFAQRRHAPTEVDQLAAILAIAARARGLPVVVRLFDAGGDKPIAWLAPPRADPAARGLSLLLHHEAVLASQLGAIERAAQRADVRLLLPLVRDEHDVATIRARLRSPVLVGAMIETPDAVERADAIARASDFVSLGTNDLASLVLGAPRETAALSMDARVVRLLGRAISSARAHGRSVTVCGELGADAHGAKVLVGLGVSGLSVPPARVGPIRDELAATTLDACRALAHAASAG